MRANPSPNPEVGRRSAKHSATFGAPDDLQQWRRTIPLNNLRTWSRLGMAASRERANQAWDKLQRVLETPAVLETKKQRSRRGEKQGLAPRDKSLYSGVAVWFVVTSSARERNLYSARQLTANTLVQRGIDTGAACHPALQVNTGFKGDISLRESAIVPRFEQIFPVSQFAVQCAVLA